MNRSAPKNVMTVDVEDYFHVEAFSDIVDRDRWDDYQSRVVENTRRTIDLLDVAGARATFFVLGWVADRHPGLVRDIAARGHELACHSHWHRLVYRLDPEEFRRDTVRARDAIEQAAGVPVSGYRAPSYSITKQSLWALDVLAELGFTYDSSIFPIYHDFYGIPTAPRRPFVVQTSAGAIVEFPMTTFRVWPFSHNFPVGGGGYLRILPFWYTRRGLRRVQREGMPFISYFHPWELDPEQPRLPGRLASRLRHYSKLQEMAGRLRQLLSLATFTSFRDSALAETAEPTNLGATRSTDEAE
jgi:polysaccharide deacetylase family protein (PEP-CTERM system associated)